MRVLGEQCSRGLVRFHQRRILPLLILDVVTPGSCFGQRVLSLNDGEICSRNLLSVAGVVERIAAHRLRIDGIRLLLLCELIVGVPERCLGVGHLGGRNIQILGPWLGPELGQHRPGRLRLRLLLLRSRALYRVIDRQQWIALVHAIALSNQHLRNRASYFRIDVDVLALRLHALDDAVGINAVGIGVGGWLEGRWLRVRLLTEDVCACERDQQARR